MSKFKNVTSEAIEVKCNACNQEYKTTDTETFKCTFCNSRDITSGKKSTIDHIIPDGDDDDNEDNI